MPGERDEADESVVTPDSANPEDTFFTDFPTFSTGEEGLSECVDAILYGREQ